MGLSARARRHLLRAGLSFVVLGLAGPVSAPQLLAFPYSASIGRYTIRAEEPIDRVAMGAILAEADALLATSPIDRPHDPVSVYLTQGGWRWKWLSLQASGAFGLTRAVNSAILINRSSIAGNRVENGQAIGGVRPLSQVIAHEETHNLLRARFGLMVDVTQPVWKREGYCDYLAGGGSLSDAQASDLERRGVAHPALPYYRGRKQVAALLAVNHGSVDALFAR